MITSRELIACYGSRESDTINGSLPFAINNKIASQRASSESICLGICTIKSHGPNMGACDTPSVPFNPFKPEFSIVIFIHHKPRIAIAIHDLWWMKMI